MNKTYTLNDNGWSVKGCSIIYAPRGQAGEYAKLSTNPYRGCGHACAYCLDGDTLIQMSDGSTKKLRNIEVGDSIIGVTIDSSKRSWGTRITTTTVLAKIATHKEAYRITLSDGTTAICSADHRWLTERGWKYTASDGTKRPRLTTNNSIRKQRKFTLEDQAISESVKVVSIEPLGKTVDMFDITTGTENFIANGMISHNCYVPKVLRMSRPDFDSGASPRPDFLNALRKDAAKYRVMGITEQVMLSFTTDPYHPFDNSLTRDVLIELQNHGLGICTLTKGGKRAMRDLDLFRPDRDAFASTLTSLDDSFSQKWERGAALPADRIATLKAFHDAGIFTWVSLEPTLNTKASLSIIEHTHEFVDLYKIGRANYLPMTSTTDWESYTHRILELVNRLGVKHYIKKDLQKYLPEGYYNPKYIDQHHGADTVHVDQIDLFSMAA